MYAACAGSVYSLSVGAQYVQTGKYRTVLCIGAETLSRIVDYTDRGTCILLADAAGAVVLRPSDDDSGIIDTDLYSDGKYWPLLYQPAGGSRRPATHETVDQRLHYAKMKGNEVFKVAVRMFGDCAERILATNGFTVQDVSTVRPAPGEPPDHRGRGEAARPAHGAGHGERGSLRQHRRRVGLRRPRGSVVGQALSTGDLVLLAAFGGGFTWGAALLRW